MPPKLPEPLTVRLPPSDTDTAELTEAVAIVTAVLIGLFVAYRVITELRLLKAEPVIPKIPVPLLVSPTLHKLIGLITFILPPVA